MHPNDVGLFVYCGFVAIAVYLVGLHVAVIVVTHIDRRTLTKSRPGRVLAAILWPLALILLILLALGKELNEHIVLPFLDIWRQMLNHD